RLRRRQRPGEEPGGACGREGRVAPEGGGIGGSRRAGSTVRDEGEPPAAGHRGKGLATPPGPARPPRLPGSPGVSGVSDVAAATELADLAAADRLAEANLLL